MIWIGIKYIHIFAKHFKLYAMRNKNEDDYLEEDDDSFSDMSYERSRFESDEDYQERMEDLENFSDYYND